MPRLQKSSNVSSAVRPSGTTIVWLTTSPRAMRAMTSESGRGAREPVLAGLQGRGARGQPVVGLGEPGGRDDALVGEPAEDLRGRSPEREEDGDLAAAIVGLRGCSMRQRAGRTRGEERAGRRSRPRRRRPRGQRSTGLPWPRSERSSDPRGRRSPKIVLEEDGRGRAVEVLLRRARRQPPRRLVRRQGLLVKPDGQPGLPLELARRRTGCGRRAGSRRPRASGGCRRPRGRSPPAPRSGRARRARRRRSCVEGDPRRGEASRGVRRRQADPLLPEITARIRPGMRAMPEE